MTTVRDLIRAAQFEVRRSDLTPSRACELLNELTSLIGNCNDEHRIADLEYKRVLLKCFDSHGTANRARIEAETTPEYVRRQEAQHAKELAVEMVRSLKIFIKSQQEEMRLTR
jgi:hypothetical protein